MLKAFTEELQPSIRRSKLIGEVTYFNEFQGYGFVRVLETKTDVFVHISEMIKAFGKKVEVNDRIKFDLVETYKGAQAQNLELVK
jgi:CspA family cold shock protein